MRKLLIIAVVILLIAAPIIAQEATCEIDLSEVENLLLEVQVAVTAGDTETALDRIAEAQEVLAAIADGCATGEFSLDATFEAENGSFTLNYPQGWLTDDSESSSTNSLVFLASSRAALEAAMDANPDPVLASGQQVIAVLVGDAATLTSNLEEGAELEDILTQFAQDMKEDYSSTSEIEYFSVNDRRAGQIAFQSDTFEALALIIEIRAGETYVALIGVAAPDEMDALRPIVGAVAETVRVES